MPEDLAAPGAALALALTFVFTAGAVGILRTRRDPDRRTELCIIILVLSLTMAAGVVVFRPLQAGDLVEERAQR